MNDRNRKCQLLVNELLARCNANVEENSDWIITYAHISEPFAYALYKNIDLNSYTLFLNKKLKDDERWKDVLVSLTNISGDWQRVIDEKYDVPPYMFFIKRMQTSTQPQGTHIDFTTQPIKLDMIDDSNKSLQKELRRMRFEKRELKNLEWNMTG